MHEPVYLRALETGDLDRIHSWHNDRDLYEMLGGAFKFVSKESTKAWLERVTGLAPQPSDEIRLAICVKETDKHVGNIYLRQINWISRNAEMQIFIGDPQERSKGYGQSALRQLLVYAFRDLNLKRVHLGVLHGNSAARGYEKAGFVVEGMLKNHVFKQGQWKDVVVMGLCAEDYQPGTV